MARANHPFICTLFCAFQTKRKMYFITQYCAGGEFFRLLKRQPDKRLSENAARFYAAEILMVHNTIKHNTIIHKVVLVILKTRHLLYTIN